MRSRCVLRMRLSWPLRVFSLLGLIRFARLVFIDENGKLDNVSVPTFLKYCQSLGLTLVEPAKVGCPAKAKPEPKAEESKSCKVIAMDEFMKRFG